jgi:hypothetical protein
MEVAYNNVGYRNQTLCPNGAQATWTSLSGSYSNVLGTKRPAYGTDNGPVDSLLLGVYNPVAGAGFFGGSSDTSGGSDNGFYSINTTTQGQYYQDADGIVRGGMAAYTSGSSDIGLPTSTASAANWISGSMSPISQSQSRPMILHRPFKNVAELGYVFSDTPWKNIDFFTPQSGDNALLDLFCTHDPTANSPLVAGKVNLNTRQPLVLQAVLSGAYRDETANLASPPAYSLPPLTAIETGSIASALVAITTGTAVGSGPLTNVGDLVGVPVSSGTSLGFVGLTGSNLMANIGPNTAPSVVQRMREAGIRPLAQMGATRVWNLMIDVVAQTGRCPQSAASAADPLGSFIVDGEQRYWVHVAIDRATGQVLDKQVEVVRQ